MSKDNHPNNLRLMGSPVNLSYRGKKKEDKKNTRNRPRSALQNSCFTPDIQERHKRPFSADAKEHIPSTRTFLKTFSVELLQSYNNSSNNLKVVAPTSELLRDTKSNQIKPENWDREVCSNASDHGSEDTYISLGTKIKARAQSPKQKNSNCKNFLKYRNIARKGKKAMENNSNESKPNNIYGLEVKITEKRDNSPVRNKNLYEERTPSPCFKTRTYDSFFQPADGDKKINEESLIGRVSFGGAFHSEVEEAIDTYNRRLNLTKQQLSLVEEESTQDLESVPSHNLSSLSPENSLEELKNTKDLNRGDGKDGYPKMIRDIAPGPRTYNSFYDDFQTPTIPPYKLSSTIIANDSSSKDSGYTDSGGTNDEKCYRRGYSLPSKTSIFQNTKPQTDLSQPKSLECIALSKDEDCLKTNPSDKKAFQFKEPLNHSRLLYKDFFLKKEGHIAVPPQNSPTKSDVENIPGSSDSINDLNPENEGRKDYPSYLLNSNTKAYTSKVIEDYKKEIAAINNLHELTLKDIKTDAISPTPLNIDKMFEQHSTLIGDKPDFNEISQESSSSAIPEVSSPSVDNSSSSVSNKKDISKVSTKELIENYLKVKEADYTKDCLPKNFNKFDKKVTNFASNVDDIMGYKQSWNNKNTSRIIASKSNATLPANNKKETQNSMSSKVPLSARIDGVENDKDIESWMSISAPSPRQYDIEDHTENPPSRNSSKSADNVPQIAATVESIAPTNTEKDKPKAKELNSDATVLDIYSMLKEIESFGDSPVNPVLPKTENATPQPKADDRANTPKDNFMEIFQFLEKVEQSANDALSVVTSTTPQTIPNLEVLLKLPQTELAQRLVTATLQLEERSCCIALLQESLTNHKEQMINKVSNLEKQSHRNIARVKQECEEAIKRHQSFIDQLINDKKTLNHRIEQLVDERRSLEERWRRSAQSLEERYKLELRNQHDKMAAAQQVARQRWVRQKAEKIKELTVKGLEGELREMAERQQKEIADIKMAHAEHMGRVTAKHSAELEELRREMETERETALVKERQIASSRMEKQILELELTYQEQRTRLVAEMRAENERVASGLCEKERNQRREIEQWREEQEKLLEEKRAKIDEEIAQEKEKLEKEMKQKRTQLEQEFESYKKEFEATQQANQKRKVTEIAAQHKLERDRAIEKAIESMEAEAQQGRRELQEALRRNKEQYETELRELAETEQATLKRYQDAQARVRQTEDRCAELEVTINQLQTRNKVLTEKTIQLDNQAEEIRSHCTMAWKEKVESLQRDIEDMRRTHDEQMHQLYAKVKVAVARKDSNIQALNREAAKYQEKITLLEQKLQQQRKDFLNKK